VSLHYLVKYKFSKIAPTEACNATANEGHINKIKCDHDRWAGTKSVRPATSLSLNTPGVILIILRRSWFDGFKETHAKELTKANCLLFETLLLKTVADWCYSAARDGSSRRSYVLLQMFLSFFLREIFQLRRPRISEVTSVFTRDSRNCYSAS